MRIPAAVETRRSERDQMRFFKGRRKMHRLGKGAFARVFGRDNYRRVVKIGYGQDAYLKYVSMIGLRNPNPYYPTLHSVKMFKHGDSRYYIIEMEKLIKWGRVPECIRDRLLAKLGCEELWTADKPKLTPDSGRHEKQLTRLLRKLLKKNNLACDIHHNNVMFRRKGRGYQLVYTDPVA